MFQTEGQLMRGTEVRRCLVHLCGDYDSVVGAQRGLGRGERDGRGGG
jgi:hypothetical protein